MDKLLADEFKTLEPYMNLPDSGNVAKVSDNLTLVKPSVNILTEYIKDDNVDKECMLYKDFKKEKVMVNGI